MRNTFNHFVACRDGRTWTMIHATAVTAMRRHRRWTLLDCTLQSCVIEVNSAGDTVAVLADWRPADAARVSAR